ncbi:hypothetical protein GOBAR_DD17733 [Gossypium barbadense]|nr:hypothetical protein GOBAR_DD17733 [Gossypium barbadense]
MGFYCGQTDRRIDGLLGFSVSTEDWCLSDEMQSLARPEGFLPVASERSRADILVVINETEKASEGFRFLRCLGKRKVCLVDVHPSIRVLRNLKLLNLRDCKSLKSLPTGIGMESLETLILSGCSGLVRFPEIDGKMKRLKTLDLSGCYRVENLSENLQQAKFLELDLSETAIAEPPSSIFQFKNLKVLSFNGRKGPSYKLLPNLPSLFKVIQGRRTNPMAQMLPLLSDLSSLRELKLRDCNLCEGDLPRDISGLSSLWPLDLTGNNFISILASLTRLSKLGNLILSNCNMCTLGEADIHGDISGISSLIRFDLSGKNFITIPLALTQLSRLKLLKLSGCKMLKSLPELPTSIAAVHIDGCS